MWKQEFIYGRSSNTIGPQGIPKSIDQAERVDMLLDPWTVTNVVELQSDAPFTTLLDRLAGRWVHKESGRRYNVQSAKPKAYVDKEQGGVEAATAADLLDDVTGEELIHNVDDGNEQVLAKVRFYICEGDDVVSYGKEQMKNWNRCTFFYKL